MDVCLADHTTQLDCLQVEMCGTSIPLWDIHLRHQIHSLNDNVWCSLAVLLICTQGRLLNHRKWDEPVKWRHPSNSSKFASISYYRNTPNTESIHLLYMIDYLGRRHYKQQKHGPYRTIFMHDRDRNDP